jgi:predicted MPP superfamily phosphohydrolase
MAFLLSLGLPLTLAFWALVAEPASLTVTHERLFLPGWPQAQSGLTIALLSDLHVGSPFNGLSKLEEIVARANDAKADLILLAGDYVVTSIPGGSLVPPEESAPLLAKLEAPLGVFAVLGNHDHWHGAKAVRAALEAAGIDVLENEGRRLAGNGFDFWLVGLGDVWEVKPDVDSILASVPMSGPAIVLTHNPDLFPEVSGRVALTLAGHTHGGQVALPLLGTPIVPSRFGDRYARGHIIEGRRHLFVTSGLGTSLLPVRFRVPPEIAVVQLEGGLKSPDPTELAFLRRAPSSGAPPVPTGRATRSIFTRVIRRLSISTTSSR